MPPLTPAIVSASPDYRAHSTEPHKTDTGGYDDNSAIGARIGCGVNTHALASAERRYGAHGNHAWYRIRYEPKWVTGNIKLVTTCSTICGMRAMRQ
jgi:hypothetical protein